MSLAFRLPGMTFREDLAGHYWWLSNPVAERPMELRLTACAPDVGAALHSRIWRLSGTVHAEGLASHNEIEGTLAFRLLDERRLPYRCRFRGDDGRLYDLCGQKEWNALAPLDTVTLLPASLYDETGCEVARATLRFDLRADWSQWLRDIKLVLPSAARL